MPISDARIQRDAGRSPRRRTGGGAGRRRLGECFGSAGRRAARQQARTRRRQPHVRQGLGADAAAAGQRRLGEAHHGALFHAERQIDPGAGIQPDVVLHPAKDATNGGRPEYSEATLRGHLRGDDEDTPGANAGEVLEGDDPITAALAELKKPVASAVAPVAAPAQKR